MEQMILLAAGILIAGVFLNRLSGRLGIPVLLAFILLGMLCGSDGIFKIPFDNYQIAEHICTLALVFVIFYGGFGTNWNQARPVAVQAMLLSYAGTFLTAVLTGGFCCLALKMPLLESLLLGAVISSTDAASVFSILRSRKLNLKYNTASLLELESGSNDPCAYMMTAVLLMCMTGSNTAGGTAYLIFAQIVYGVLLSMLVAFGALWIFQHVSFGSAGFDAVFLAAVALLAYAAPASLGGNGFLSAYLVGILLGNGRIPNKKALVHFFDGVTGLMQIVLFFVLGLLAFPSQLPGVLAPALLTALFLTFVARPAAVFILLAPFRSCLAQMLLVSWSGLRGAASIAFAVMATISPATTNQDLFHIVLTIVLFSIALQGFLIPLVSRKLDMLDESADVMRTFNDYSDQIPVQFIRFSVPEGHAWAGQRVRDILLPPGTLLVLLQRDGEKLVPSGQTKLLARDTLILSARAPDPAAGITLVEKRIGRGDPWIGKAISAVSKDSGELIITIQRGSKYIIPNGDTLVQENDLLTLHTSRDS